MHVVADDVVVTTTTATKNAICCRQCFTLSIPHDDKVVKGCGASKTKSKNTWENLRPGFFFDALLVRGIDADDQTRYSVTSDTFMV